MKVKAATAYPATTFTTTSATYVDLLNGSGGSVISISITKSSTTNLHVRGMVQCFMSGSTGTATLGVNDGTNDYDLSRSTLSTTNQNEMVGDKIITGLGAGTFTLKLRVKRSAGTFNFDSNASACLSVTEIAP